VFKFDGYARLATAEERRWVKGKTRQQLAIYEARFAKNGRAEYLLRALDWCLRTRTRPPLWVANAFCDRMLTWLSYRQPTLDKAFGIKPLHRNTLKAKIDRMEIAPWVITEIARRHKENPKKSVTAIIGDLDHELGAKLGAKERTVWKYYDDPGVRWLRRALGLPDPRKRRKPTAR
jgi:hypothetical protein